MKPKPERAELPAPIPARLPVFQHKGKLVADSRDIAPFVEKDHAHLLRDIRRYVKVMEQANGSNFGLVESASKYLTESKVGFSGTVSKYLGDNNFVCSDYFIPATYIDPTGRELPSFYCTEMGCEMVANKMTGDKGILFTAQYVQAFHAMRDELARRRELRVIGKPIRRSLTDALRDSGEVERMKGHAYGTYTNLAFKLATGLTARQLRRERGAAQDARAVDILTAAELEIYQRKEAAIAVLLDAGLCMTPSRPCWPERGPGHEVSPRRMDLPWAELAHAA